MDACEQMDAYPLFTVKDSCLPIIAPMARVLNPGGQHRAPQGLTSRDSLSAAERREDHARRLAAFNREVQRAIDGVEWAAEF